MLHSAPLGKLSGACYTPQAQEGGTVAWHSGQANSSCCPGLGPTSPAWNAANGKGEGLQYRIVRSSAYSGPRPMQGWCMNMGGSPIWTPAFLRVAQKAQGSLASSAGFKRGLPRGCRTGQWDCQRTCGEVPRNTGDLQKENETLKLLYSKAVGSPERYRGEKTFVSMKTIFCIYWPMVLGVWWF